jgi:hypothetical protein
VYDEDEVQDEEKNIGAGERGSYDAGPLYGCKLWGYLP